MSRPPSDPSLPQDPHLQAALRHAPDADAQAPAALSARILEAAREQAARQSPPQPAAAARARPAPAPWWKRLLGEAGPGPRWASGLALLFVTVVAGLIWLPERPGVDIQPPRPQAETERRLQERGAGPTAGSGGQPTPAEAPVTAVPRREMRPAPAATAGKLEKARERTEQPGSADKQDSDRLADAAPKPMQDVARAAPPPMPAAEPPPAPVAAARRQAAVESANEDSIASMQEAEKKSTDARAAGRARAAMPSAPRAEGAAPPWQTLRSRLAQPAASMALSSSKLKEVASSSRSATWQLLPQGRPQPAGLEALGWLDELAAATGEWKPADAPPALLRGPAWSVEWQAPGLGAMQLLMQDGQAWWHAPDGRWWQAELPDTAAATLQRNARGLLLPPEAAKPGNPD